MLVNDMLLETGSTPRSWMLISVRDVKNGASPGYDWTNPQHSVIGESYSWSVGVAWSSFEIRWNLVPLDSFSQNHVKSKQEYTLPVDMAHSSNVISNSTQYKEIRIQNSMGNLWKVRSEQHWWPNEGLYDNYEFLLERYVLNITHRLIVTLISAWPFDRLF